MTETILRLLTRLSEAGDDAIIPGELAAPFLARSFEPVAGETCPRRGQAPLTIGRSAMRVNAGCHFGRSGKGRNGISG